MSPHIQTRPYRAPEIILLEPQYHFAIDVWGAGVVVAEIFQHFCHGPVKKGVSPYCFSSMNCFPMSPGTEVLEDDGLPN